MKYLPLIFAALVSGGGWAATPLDSRNPQQVITADYFLETCSVIGETAYGMVPHFDCETYIYGVLDTYKAVNAGLPAADRICLPATLAPWRVYEALPTPESESGREENAATYIIDSLRKAYPCQ